MLASQLSEKKFIRYLFLNKVYVESEKEFGTIFDSTKEHGGINIIMIKITIFVMT